MIAVKGKYNGTAVVLDETPITYECEVIVTFLDSFKPVKSVDDGSLVYLFRNYIDDSIREPVIDFGESVGNELW